MEPPSRKKDWVLTYWIQYTERSIPKTRAVRVSRKELKEEEHVITGHLDAMGLMDLLDCDLPRGR